MIGIENNRDISFHQHSLESNNISWFAVSFILIFPVSHVYRLFLLLRGLDNGKCKKGQVQLSLSSSLTRGRRFLKFLREFWITTNYNAEHWNMKSAF